MVSPTVVSWVERDLEHLAKQVKVKLDEEGPIKDVMVQQKQHSS